MLALTATADDDAWPAAIDARSCPFRTRSSYEPGFASQPRTWTTSATLQHRDDYLANPIASAAAETVIYVNSREQSVAAGARMLRRAGAAAGACIIGFYNAGLARAERKRIEELFRTDALSVLVATSAFGEGVDIPNIRHVVLYHLPFSDDASSTR